MTINDYSKQFSVNERTARRDLRELIENNFIEKKGKTKGAYFNVK